MATFHALSDDLLRHVLSRAVASDLMWSARARCGCESFFVLAGVARRWRDAASDVVASTDGLSLNVHGVSGADGAVALVRLARWLRPGTTLLLWGSLRMDLAWIAAQCPHVRLCAEDRARWHFRAIFSRVRGGLGTSSVQVVDPAWGAVVRRLPALRRIAYVLSDAEYERAVAQPLGATLMLTVAWVGSLRERQARVVAPWCVVPGESPVRQLCVAPVGGLALGALPRNDLRSLWIALRAAMEHALAMSPRLSWLHLESAMCCDTSCDWLLGGDRAWPRLLTWDVLARVLRRPAGLVTGGPESRVERISGGDSDGGVIALRLSIYVNLRRCGFFLCHTFVEALLALFSGSRGFYVAELVVTIVHHEVKWLNDVVCGPDVHRLIARAARLVRAAACTADVLRIRVARASAMDVLYSEVLPVMKRLFAGVAGGRTVRLMEVYGDGVTENICKFALRLFRVRQLSVDVAVSRAVCECCELVTIM